MKECKSCGIFIRSGEYCIDCILNGKNNNSKDLNSSNLGNPEQDAEILEFIRRKRKKNNKKYKNK